MVCSRVRSAWSSPSASTCRKSSASTAIARSTRSIPPHLRHVAHAAQQPVADARRATRAAGDHLGALGADGQAEDGGGARDDAREVGDRVVLEPEVDAEPVVQRLREHAGARGGADQRERRQVEAQRARARPGADHDVDHAVLHGRVEQLLDRPWRTVDLVDEQHVVRLERRQDRCHVALALQRRAGDGVDPRAHLVGDDVREAGLAKARRARQQHVVARLTATARGLEVDRQLPDHPRLAEELGEPLRPQRSVVLGPLLGRVDHALVHDHRATAPRRRASPARTRSSSVPSTPSRAASQSASE